MRVLSLFDGISCGLVALKRAGIPVTQYFASEIDKHAITIARKNHPEIVHLGDVVSVRQMAEAGLLNSIDLVIGGSPCQGFSPAGKQLAFDDPRSVLFFEFVRIVRAIPNVKFLLENVRMKKEHLDTISAYTGVQPVCINSALVSAQNRVRYYWCNWSVDQPEDRGIYLRDIVEDGEHPEHILSKSAQQRAARTKHSKPQIMPDKTGTLNTKNNSGQLSFDKGTTLVPVGPIKDRGELKVRNHKSMCLDANYYKGADNHGHRTIIGIAGNTEVRKDDSITYRKLTPIECERLQTLPDNYTEGVSNTQRYKQLGNGWTVDVIAHIFKGLPQ